MTFVRVILAIYTIVYTILSLFQDILCSELLWIFVVQILKQICIYVLSITVHKLPFRIVVWSTLTQVIS